MRTLLLFLLFVTATSFGQTLTVAQQKALNSYVDYANQSADEVSAVVKTIVAYYPEIHRKSSWGAPRYTCPVQIEEFYFNAALKEAKVLSPTISTPLNSKLQDLRAAADKIDARSKALDTYHKLEDYKQDNFAKAESLVVELQLLVADYKEKQDALADALESIGSKLNSGATQTPYYKTETLIRKAILKEREFLNVCSFNVKEEVHTGWQVDLLKKSIEDTDKQLKQLVAFKPALKYPTSSMLSNFQESLSNILEAKRNGLDDYNYEAKKSDKHSNDVYLSLINYFNGMLVSNQNMFVQYAFQDGYHGLKAIKYFPLFEIRTQQHAVEVSVKPFKDIQYSAVAIAQQKTALSKPAYNLLVDYVEFINETWRQTRYMKMVLGSFNSTASYYKSLDSYERRAGMSFVYKDFTLPLSQFQKIVSSSKLLPPTVVSSLNAQSEVLLNILKEMDDLAASLEIETKEKRYEKDRLKKVYEILEREKTLMDVWDARKELLNADIRKVFDAYQNAPASSWYKSGKVLRDLTDLDHKGLFEAKSHYANNAPTTVSTESIDATLRDVIANEYDNMKGIEKYGRSNGLCPYTPYEEVPNSSKLLSEELKKLKPVQESANEHPYSRMIYHYNDVVRYYNEFCELSTAVQHLPTVMQPELFQVKYPKSTIVLKEQPTASTAENAQPPVAQPTAVPMADQSTGTNDQKTMVPATEPVHTAETIIVERQTIKVEHDTIFIEKTDTVYVAEPGEDTRSMEGYAINNMVLLLDVSGSMNSPDKLPLLKKSVLDLLSMMRLEDKVSIIAFSGKPKALLTAASFKDEARIRKAIDELKPLGKTDGNAGVKLAYKIADDNYLRGGNNRIILATDGEFGLNNETRRLIEKFSREDIYLSVFNFGKGAGASKTLEGVAALAKGNYRYISRQNVDLQLIREVKAKKKK
ncbi:MAG: VWA domain-containing protein [Chryseolinea sp.]